MIRKLKTKFILLAMVTIALLLAVIISGMNLINYNSVIEEADKTLSFLSQNKGTFPESGDKPNDRLPPHMSPETPYESRFFWVLSDEHGNVINTDVGKISSVGEAEAVKYAEYVQSKNSDSGFAGSFRYIVKREQTGIRITFLDCGRKLDSFYSFLYASIFMAVIGLIVGFFVIFILSGKIIKPIAESQEKQKQFITDAGHEIKTPLTIINANVDILEMELGEENESLADIKSQTLRLRSLTDDLVLLTRMEEAENKMQKIDFPVSEVVSDATHSFSSLTKAQGKTLTCHIQPLLSLNGNDKAISELVSILLDNALKYSAEGSEIELCLTGQGHSIILTVSNTTELEIKPEQLDRIFDRFYRADTSRNSESGGHGIGLSVAKAIVNAHNGKISAAISNPNVFKITAVFPK
ncbi:MAG: sensor histidine kinase [Eubacteriales bacterium]